MNNIFSLLLGLTLFSEFFSKIQRFATAQLRFLDLVLSESSLWSGRPKYGLSAKHCIFCRRKLLAKTIVSYLTVSLKNVSKKL